MITYNSKIYLFEEDLPNNSLVRIHNTGTDLDDRIGIIKGVASNKMPPMLQNFIVDISNSGWGNGIYSYQSIVLPNCNLEKV